MTIPNTMRRLGALEAQARAAGSGPMRMQFQQPNMLPAELDVLDAERAAWEAEGYKVLRVSFVHPLPPREELH